MMVEIGYHCGHWPFGEGWIDRFKTLDQGTENFKDAMKLLRKRRKVLAETIDEELDED